MRTTILLAGLAATLAACSDSAPSRTEASDARGTPDLALTRSAETSPVASDIEVHRSQTKVDITVPETEPAREDASSENSTPLGSPIASTITMAEAKPAEESDTHGDHGAVAAADANSVRTEEGGGKPTDMADGGGRVPDIGWGEPVIYDDPGIGIGPIGRGVPVIIRGGPGGVDDDCAIHPRGIGAGVAIGGGSGPRPGDALVNDRTGRRSGGVSINERAPRTRPGGSMPRGGGFRGGRGIR